MLFVKVAARVNTYRLYGITFSEVELPGWDGDQLFNFLLEGLEVAVGLVAADGVLVGEVVGGLPLVDVVLDVVVVEVQAVGGVVVVVPLAEHPVVPLDASGEGVPPVHGLLVPGEDVADGI